MADLEFALNSDDIALVASATKTILQATAPAQQRVICKGWSVNFKGLSTTAEPIEVLLVFQTTAGTFTNTPTGQKIDGSMGETVQTVGKHTPTAEPTLGDVVRRKTVHPQMSYSEYGDKIAVLGGGDRLAIVCVTPAGTQPNVIGELLLDE
jgi:hypothetical protein